MDRFDHISSWRLVHIDPLYFSRPRPLELVVSATDAGGHATQCIDDIGAKR